ncbi:phage major capsid protein [Micromonospora sp. NPDC005652]|uniref:phage major capsid family protein n=1 Tax=Micromonospora sp. NPDC005652 TaxID=3157046 RepID=UPI0033C187DC
MASLATSSFSLPKHLASGIWSKATTGSTVAALSGSEPMLFGETQLMTFTTQPKAQFVAEGATKSGTDPAFGTKTATPRKAQVTMRFNEEVQWADEDYQLGVLSALADSTSNALARALDLGIYHAINPLTGVALSGSPAKVLDTGNNVELTTSTVGTPDLVVETAAGLVIADGYTPNGIALDPSYAWSLATARYSDGRKKYPDLGLGVNVTNFEGLRASVSSTVSAPEAAIVGGAYASSNPNVKAVLGDFTQIRWGVQRRIGVEKILYGDPDGQGDLKAKNQIALRAEVVYGWAIMDTDAFAVVKDAVTNV